MSLEKNCPKTYEKEYFNQKLNANANIFKKNFMLFEEKNLRFRGNYKGSFLP